MKKKEFQHDYFFLTNKEEAAMNVLWSYSKPLSASEIAENIPERNWPASSIQSILRGLEKKKAIKVAEITKLGKSYGRLFLPTLTANEYATMQFNRYFKKNDKDSLSLLSTLLGDATNSKKEFISTLQNLLDEQKEG